MPEYSPTFTVQGQIYYQIGSLFPRENEQHKLLHVYFIGNEGNEVNGHCQYIEGIERDTVLKIQMMLHNHNILINTFKTAIEKWPQEDYKVVIHADRTPRGEHERRYTAPTINEVAAVVSVDQFFSRDIALLRAHDNTLTRVADTRKFYDALQYPLILARDSRDTILIFHSLIPLQNSQFQ